MDTLLIFGRGYTGVAIARGAAAAGFAPILTSRSDVAPEPGVDIITFDEAAPAIARATAIVSTVPPPGDGGEEADEVDPVMARYGEAIRAALDGASGLRWVGYLSTTGVYGNRDGGWVDEDTAPAPGQARSQRRLAAEDAWRALADGVALDIFRVAGIYGPGRSALDDVRAGRARRVVKPGHDFGRIHRDDIAGAVLAAAAQSRRPGVRVLHLADDHPAPQADVVAEAARLLGVAPPEPVAFEAIVGRMSAMALSFWAENRKVASAKTQARLGRRWSYPSYREGLARILAEEGRDHAQQQSEIART